MVALVVVMAFVGAMFGAVEVITVAFAAERGEAGATGLVLAAYALGSLVAGLGYGAVRWRSSAARRFLVGQVAMALLLVPVALATTVPVLALGLFVAGVAISPTIISGNALVQELVVPARLTEGLTWLSTGLGIGVSAGAAVAGQIIDAAGAQRALLLPVACGGVAALLALACARVLNRPPLA
jgi:MFS family permease